MLADNEICRLKLYISYVSQLHFSYVIPFIFFLPNTIKILKKDMKKFFIEHCNNLGVNNLISHYRTYTPFPNKQFMHFVVITQMKGQRTWYLDP